MTHSLGLPQPVSLLFFLSFIFSLADPRPHPVAYAPTALQLGVDGTVTAECTQPPAKEWVACFIDAEFDGGFRFTSQVSISPRRRPHRACSGADCARMV